jgi:hypothetical protein
MTGLLTPAEVDLLRKMLTKIERENQQQVSDEVRKVTRYRLLADCHLDGCKHKRGAILERPDGWRGPMRSVRIEAQKYGDPLGGTPTRKRRYSNRSKKGSSYYAFRT